MAESKYGEVAAWRHCVSEAVEYIQWRGSAVRLSTAVWEGDHE